MLWCDDHAIRLDHLQVRRQVGDPSQSWGREGPGLGQAELGLDAVMAGMLHQVVLAGDREAIVEVHPYERLHQLERRSGILAQRRQHGRAAGIPEAGEAVLGPGNGSERNQEKGEEEFFLHRSKIVDNGETHPVPDQPLSASVRATPLCRQRGEIQTAVIAFLQISRREV